jgi:hypothetical protein
MPYIPSCRDAIYLYTPWCRKTPAYPLIYAVMPGDTSVSTYIRRDARRHKRIHLYTPWCQETQAYPLISVVMPGVTSISTYIRRDAVRHPRIPIYPPWCQETPSNTHISVVMPSDTLEYPYIRRDTRQYYTIPQYPHTSVVIPPIWYSLSHKDTTITLHLLYLLYIILNLSYNYII